MLIARQWIAGTSVKDAIDASRQINVSDEHVILNYLGEDIKDPNAVNRNVLVYVQLLKRMHSDRILGSISVKPTQLGLSIKRRLFLENYEALLRFASKLGIFIWLDMENYEYIDDTIDAYLSMHRKYRKAGVCMQAKVRRTYSDIKRIVKAGGRIRLVKGAYSANQSVVYGSKEEVDANYLKCMLYLFKSSNEFMIATHDDKIIGKALELKHRYRKRVEFAMLRGVRGKLARKLAGEGESMNIYVPFGEEWFAYSLRRLREEGHLLLLLRSVFQG